MVYFDFRRKREHEKAKAVVIITAAVWATATIWNVRQMSRDIRGRYVARARPPGPAIQLAPSW